MEKPRKSDGAVNPVNPYSPLEYHRLPFALGPVLWEGWGDDLEATEEIISSQGSFPGAEERSVWGM